MSGAIATIEPEPQPAKKHPRCDEYHRRIEDLGDLLSEIADTQKEILVAIKGPDLAAVGGLVGDISALKRRVEAHEELIAGLRRTWNRIIIGVIIAIVSGVFGIAINAIANGH